MRLRLGLGLGLGLAAILTWGMGSAAWAQQASVQVEFTNEKLTPSHWVLKLDAQGNGQFDADAGAAPVREASQNSQVMAGEVHRQMKLSAEYSAHVFDVARRKRLFDFPCESHLKVAFQGTKRLSYSGPEGSGSCEFNYSKDKEIQALGESLMSVEATLMYGARLEKMLQHDRLGLDQEMENLSVAVKDGAAVEIGTIQETLTRIAGDEQVLERARRKARLLLAQAH